MASERVTQYIAIADAFGRPVNTSIVSRATLDYLPGLTPEELRRATYEVEKLSRSTSNQEWDSEALDLQRFIEAEAAIAGLNATGPAAEAAASAAAAQASAAQAADSASDAFASAAQANTSAGNAAASAVAAQNSATTASASAATAGSSASAAQTFSAAASTSASQAQTAASQAAASASAAAAVVSSLVAPCFATVRAASVGPISVAAGAGPTTLIPLPAAALQGNPLTRPGDVWSIVNGVLVCTQPGVYQFDLTAAFVAGLLGTGVARIYVAAGTAMASPSRVIADQTLMAAQISLLNLQQGVGGGGMITVAAGTEIAIMAGHTQAITAANLTFETLRLSVRRLA